MWITLWKATEVILFPPLFVPVNLWKLLKYNPPYMEEDCYYSPHIREFRSSPRIIHIYTPPTATTN